MRDHQKVGGTMDEKWTLLLAFIEASGFFAPVAFILFHILRQVLFIPVVIVCIAGGLLFGSILGFVYSLIGLTLSSLCIYIILKKTPKVYKKLQQIKEKWFGIHANLTVGQIAVLKLIPFMHFQLLSFCLLERKRTFWEYVKSSFFTNIPLAFFYTVFGQFIKKFTPSIVLIVLAALSILIIILREKVVIIKWKDFFKATT